ncbi:MAG: hypothetical protein GEU78_14135 [Actinobacteria bacterium]|nr:hypothetical protein [Actinomycetota bacterium]
MPAERKSELFVPPDSTAVYKGHLIPGSNVVRAMIVQLKDEIAVDKVLAGRWESEPRVVLAERGLIPDYQDEVLKAEGRLGREADCTITSLTGCCVTLI